MKPDVLTFGSYVLDARESCLIVGEARVALSPKDCALLHYLVANPDRTLSHAELLSEVWGDVAVGPEVLKVRIARLRRLLSDSAAAPRYIANVHGEGYRFLQDGSARAAARTGPESLVGRVRESAHLAEARQACIDGRRRLVFVAGEAGIGKSMLVEQFAAGLNPKEFRVGRGRCIEHYGAGEPFLPLMEALGRLARQPDGSQVNAALTRFAPSWLLHLPDLVSDADRPGVLARALGSTRERMLRELVEALEALGAGSAAHQGIVILIDDLHWADVSTLDFLRMLAARSEPARVLVVAIYRRPEQAAASEHVSRLVRDVCGTGTATQIVIGPLSSTDVARYLDERFAEHEFPAALASMLHRRTGGNPLFLREVLRELRDRGALRYQGRGWIFDGDVSTVDRSVPASVWQLAARFGEQLTPEDQSLLAAASAVGLEFSAAAVAAAMARDAIDVEEDCIRLAARESFIRPDGFERWPDNTQAQRFAFQHGLYRDYWHAHASHARRRHWHLRIAECREAAFGPRAPEIAAELAAHFEHGGDAARAVAYRQHAAMVALQRTAHVEARAHVDHALELLGTLAEDMRREYELPLLVTKGTLAAFEGGYGSPDAEAAFSQAHAVCRDADDVPTLVSSAFGLCRVFWARGQLARAGDIADQMQSMIGRDDDPVRTMAVQTALGSVRLAQGRIREAVGAFETATALAHHWHERLVGVYASDLQIVATSSLASSLHLAGSPDRSQAYSEEVLRIGASRIHPVSRDIAVWSAALLYQWRHDLPRVQACLTQLAGSSHGIPELQAFSAIFGGWMAAVDAIDRGGIDRLREGIEVLRRMGAHLYEPYALGLLVEAHLVRHDVDQARAAVMEAIRGAHEAGDYFYTAELYRLRGEAMVISGDASAAEDAFRQAVSVARQQHLKAWELRAGLSLARLLARQGKVVAARRHLSAQYCSFAEGFDTPDLRAAAEHLAEWAPR